MKPLPPPAVAIRMYARPDGTLTWQIRIAETCTTPLDTIADTLRTIARKVQP